MTNVILFMILIMLTLNFVVLHLLSLAIGQIAKRVGVKEEQ